MEKIDLTWLWTTLAGGLSALITWFLARKKQRAEVKTNELDNVEKAIAIWRKMAEDLSSQVQQAHDEIVSLREEVKKLENLVETLTDKAETLEDENKALRARVSELERTKA